MALAPMTGLLRVLGLEPGDAPRVAPMFGAYFLTLTALYVLKPARNALFLQGEGVAALPWVLLAVAVVGGATALAYGRIADRLQPDRLVPATFGAMALLLIGFRGVLASEARWSLYAFFVFVQVFGLLTTSLVWLWANSAFDPREARRAFGLIGTGGILGSIFGGGLTGLVAPSIGTSNLLLIAAALLLAVVVVLRRAPPLRMSPASGRRPGEVESGVEGQLPRLLALNASVIGLVAVFVDVQFNSLVEKSFAEAEAKAAFFGLFFAGISGVSLLVQLFLTPWMLRRFGLGPALALLPAALGAGAGLLLGAPTFPLGAAPKAADGSLRHSVHKAATEVVFLPVPAAQKQRAKLFIDTTVDTAATGLGALLVLGLTGPLGWSYDSLSLPILLGAGLSLWTVLWLRRAYVAAFRRALETRRLDEAALTSGLNEAAVADVLQSSLRSAQPRQLEYVLDLAASTGATGLGAELRPLLDHPAGEVRRRALALMEHQADALPIDVLERMVEDEDEGVRDEAMFQRLWVRAEHEDLGPSLDASAPEAAAALRVLERSPRPELLTSDRVERLRRLPETRAPLAAAITAAGPEYDALLGDLIERAPLDVVDGAIRGMTRTKDPLFVPMLINALRQRKLRGPARRGLSAFGSAASSQLARMATSREEPLPARRAAIRALAEINDRPSVEALVTLLREDDVLLSTAALRGLSRAQPRFLPRGQLRRCALDRIQTARLAQSTLTALRAHAPLGAGARIFERSLKEQEASAVSDAFSLLGLLYDQDEMRDAHRNLERARAEVLEFLDNTLRGALKDELLSLLESEPPLARLDACMRAWNRQPDPWLRACALYAWAEIEGREVLDGASDPHPLVQQTLQHLRVAS